MEKRITPDLDTVITADNVKTFGENIALCALKHFLPYRKVENYYFGLIRDIHRHTTLLALYPTDTILRRQQFAFSVSIWVKHSVIWL